MSFGWLGTFRVGQWKAFRQFVLNERRDANWHIECIEAELRRIGNIIVVYEKQEVQQPTPSGDVRTSEIVTEKRKALYVTRNTSLQKLMKAYTAQGGNPFDISMFLRPDSAAYQDRLGINQDPSEDSLNLTGLDRIYPHDGVVAPETPASFNPSGGVYSGGFLTWGKYPWRDIQDRIPDGDRNAGIAARVDHARRWCQQAIYEKRNNLEAKIIKLMDLREQLILERDHVMSQAVGGSVGRLASPPDPEIFHTDFHLTAIVSDIDKVIFQELGIGGVTPQKMSENRFNYDTVLDDKPEDANTAL